MPATSPATLIYKHVAVLVYFDRGFFFPNILNYKFWYTYFDNFIPLQPIKILNKSQCKLYSTPNFFDRANEEWKASEEQKDHPEHLACLALLDPLDPLESLAPKDQMASLDHLASRDALVTRDLKDPLDG